MLTVRRTPFRAKLEAILILILLLSVGSILVVALYVPFLVLLYVLFFWSSPLITILLAVYILDLRGQVRSLNERVETLEDQAKESGS